MTIAFSFPNPVTDILHISSFDIYTEPRFMIFDIIGNQVYNGIIKNTITKIDISELQPGQYYISCVTNDQFFI